jgi:hypothetical protein
MTSHALSILLLALLAGLALPPAAALLRRHLIPLLNLFLYRHSYTPTLFKIFIPDLVVQTPHSRPRTTLWIIFYGPMKMHYVRFCMGGLIPGAVVMTSSHPVPRPFPSFNPTATSGLSYWTRNSLHQRREEFSMSKK